MSCRFCRPLPTFFGTSFHHTSHFGPGRENTTNPVNVSPAVWWLIDLPHEVRWVAHVRSTNRKNIGRTWENQTRMAPHLDSTPRKFRRLIRKENTKSGTCKPCRALGNDSQKTRDTFSVACCQDATTSNDLPNPLLILQVDHPARTRLGYTLPITRVQWPVNDDG